MSQPHKLRNLILKIVGWTLSSIVILLFAIILFIRSPWGQDIIITKAVDFVSQKIGTKVSIEKLFITFGGSVSLEGLYLEDQSQDTLLYSDNLEISIELLPIIRGEKLDVRLVKWNGLVARVNRDQTTEKYNFDYIVEAFAPDSTASTPTDTTASQSLKFELGKIRFTDFDLRLSDPVSGMDADLQLGELTLKMDELDMETMLFHIDELQLRNTQITYKQTKPLPPSTDTTTSSSGLPTLIVDDLILEDLELLYESTPDKMKAQASIAQLTLDLPEANLQKQLIRLNEFSLANSKIYFHDFSVSPEATSTDTTDSKSSRVPFQWPAWDVIAEDINFENNSFIYKTDSLASNSKQFNPENIHIAGFELKLKDVKYKPEAASLTLEAFRFNERSGFRLKQLAMKANLDSQSISIENLNLNTKDNALAGNLSVSYQSFEQLIAAPLSASVAIDLNQIKLDLNEAFAFAPELASDPYLRSLSKNKIEANVNLEGDTSMIDIKSFNLKWNDTKASIKGIVKNPMNTTALEANIPTLEFYSTRKDLLTFVSEADLGVNMPKSIEIKGVVDGSLQRTNARLDVKMPEGKINIVGTFNQEKSLAFKSKIKVQSLDLGTILGNDQIGVLTFDITANGTGENLQNLNGELYSNFEKLELKGYDYAGLFFGGKITQGLANVQLKFNDENLKVGIQASARLDSLLQNAQLSVNLEGADLKAINLTSKDIRTRFNLKANYTTDSTKTFIKASIRDGIAVYNSTSYPFGEFEADAMLGIDSTNVNVKSRILDLELISNQNTSQLTTSLKRQFGYYLVDSLQIDSIADPSITSLRMKISESPLLRDILLSGLERLDETRIHVDFSEANHTINADISAPYIQYAGSQINALKVSANGDAKKLTFDLGWSLIESEPIQIEQTSITGSVQNKKLLFDIEMNDEEERMVFVRSEVEMLGDTIIYHIDPENLTFNKMPWVIPKSNRLEIGDEYISFHNFTFSQNNQSFGLKSIREEDDAKISLSFENFGLETFTSLLNPDQPIGTGLMNGELTIEHLFGNMGFLAQLNISELKVMDVAAGNLKLDASSKDGSSYDAKLSIVGQNIDLKVDADYVLPGNIDADINLSKLNLTIVEALIPDLISQTSGAVSASIKVNGDVTNPQYKGSIGFDQASAVANMLQSQFTIVNDKITLDNKGIQLGRLTIEDAGKNKFVLEGEILTKDLLNPSFDLTLKANNFTAIDSKQGNNPLFYGKFNLSTDLTIKGDLNIPIVNGQVKVNKATEFTFIVPESQLELVEREGVVTFTNRQNPDNILTRKADTTSTSSFTGIDLDVVLKVNDDAIFNVVIDEKTGDNLQISGDGDFAFGIETNGRTTLSGRFEVNSGHYEASLYGLVKRRFDIADGSTIIWKGDPLEAEMDIRAIYKVKTSAAPLMAVQTAGESSNETQKFQQKLNFLVYLNLEGELLKPEISFNLDMPDDDQGALGGEVYGTVQQLNNREEELNKQVFSLLVMNRFFPGTGSDGSSGGPASIARDNVNKVLSSQLNNFSDKLLGSSGFELDFGLESYQNYESETPQEETQLDISAKKGFFNNRLIVQVGSEVNLEGAEQQQTADQASTPMVGNVSLEYLITENGRYRIKGFRKNQYEGIIDGQLTVTGLGFIFNREFNKFNEIFRNQPANKREEEEPEDEPNEE